MIDSQPLPSPSSRSTALHPAALLVIGCALGIAGVFLRGSALNLALFHSINSSSTAWAAWGSAGSVLGLGAVPLIVAVVLGPRRAGAAAAVLVALVVCGLLVQVLKALAAEARPLAQLGPDAMHVVGMALRGRAMPSGHAAAGACAAALVWAALPRRPGLWGAAVLLSMIAVFEGWSRIAVGAHWPADVLAGWGLGLISGWIVFGTARAQAICLRIANWLRTPVGTVLLAVAVVYAGATLWKDRQDYPLAIWLDAVLFAAAVLAALRWLLALRRRSRTPSARAAAGDAVGSP